MLFLLGPHRVLSASVSIPWRGCWVADLVLDPELPTDPADGAKLPLVLGDNAPLLGTVDGSRTGSFGSTHKCRVIGGLGWRKELPPQHFHSPGQLVSPAVIAPTAAAVGEVAVVVLPAPLGTDYVRHAGAASRVLDGVEWHVELVGTTTVGPRLPKPLNPLDVELLSFDPATRMAELGGTTIVEPGALILPDPLRGLNETLTVRHVRVEIGEAGFRTFAHCGLAPTDSGDALVSRLRSLVREVARTEYFTLARYRVALPGPEDGTYLLQAVELGDKADLVPAKVWPGMAGLAAKLLPSSIVLVAFGTGMDPMIVGFDDSTPLELSLDAAISVTIGGPSAMPLVTSPGLQAALTAAGTAAAGLGPTVSGAALQGILNALAAAIQGASTVKTSAA